MGLRFATLDVQSFWHDEVFTVRLMHKSFFGMLTGILFGLAHGLVQALPLLVAFGIGLAYLRSRVDSVYPGMVVHGLFNAASLVLAVTH